MATYKVIQDIESEDKLLGPLTLRQFIYAIVVIALGFIAFKLASINPILIVPFLPPMAFFGLLAAPFGHDQSSEVWLLSKIRFMLKPHRRLWDQTGMQEFVTITVPKQVEKVLTDGLSQFEVKSRLQALANTIDSRGWAVKNVNVNLSAQPSYIDTSSSSDRLIGASSLPQDSSSFEVYATDDMMDINNNRTAQQLTTLINQSQQAHKQALVATAQGNPPAKPTTPPADYWFMNQADQSKIPAGQASFAGSSTVIPGTPAVNNASDDGAGERALLDQIHRDQAKPNPMNSRMKVLQPIGSQNPTSQHPAQPTPLPPRAKAEIAQLSRNNDLNVSTIARQANKATAPTKKPSDDEVVISLR